MKVFHLLFILLFSLEYSKASVSHAAVNVLAKKERTLKSKGLVPSADLVITEISFISIYFDVSSKTYLVKVIVVIRNAGTEASIKTKIEAYTKPSDGTGSWKVMGNAANIPAINPGSSYKSEFSFKESILSVGTVSFDLRVKIDPKNMVAESDKKNNYSESILINPRAY